MDRKYLDDSVPGSANPLYWQAKEILTKQPLKPWLECLAQARTTAEA